MIIQSSQSNTREGLALYAQSGYTARFRGSPAGKEEVHYGDVPFCEAALGRAIRPNYYPEWLRPIFGPRWPRLLIATDYQVEMSRRLFVKDATRYKSDIKSRVYEEGEILPPGEYILSNVIDFEHEWRILVVDGKITDASYYDGLAAEDDAFPVLPAHDTFLLSELIPQGWCGTVDVGLTSHEELCLVETHHPFAIGWYGDDASVYRDFVTEGWRYLQ